MYELCIDCITNKFVLSCRFQGHDAPRSSPHSHFTLTYASRKMNLDTATLRQVFNALDSGNRGYITVEQFTSALEKFYTSSMPVMTEEDQKPQLARMPSMVCISLS